MVVKLVDFLKSSSGVVFEARVAEKKVLLVSSLFLLHELHRAICVQVATSLSAERISIDGLQAKIVPLLARVPSLFHNLIRCLHLFDVAVH